jgi:hypothetical protein
MRYAFTSASASAMSPGKVSFSSLVLLPLAWDGGINRQHDGRETIFLDATDQSFRCGTFAVHIQLQ